MAKTKTRPRRSAAVQMIDNETGEVTERLLPSTIPLPEEFGEADLEIHRKVTIPVLPWPDGATLTFKSLGAIYEGKEMTGERGGKPKMAPADLMKICGIGGSVRLIIAGSVLRSELEDKYPDESYVGKWFRATKSPPNEAKGKRYATYEIDEVKPPNGFKDPVS